MKAAIIHNKRTGSYGGTKKVCLEFAKELVQRGLEVEVFWEHNQRETQEICSSYGKSEVEEKANFNSFDSKILTVSRLLDATGRFQLLSRGLKNLETRKIAKQLDKDFDVIIFTSQIDDLGVDFSSTTVQYFHDYSDVAASTDLPIYKNLVNFLPVGDVFEADFNFCNSKYVLSKLDVSADLLRPPVNKEYKSVPWKDRANRAVIAGRISGDKNIKEAVQIVSKVEDLDLLVAGFSDDEEYLDELRELSKKHSFLKIETDLSSGRFERAIRYSKYGLNCKREENFGITTLQYMRNGVVPVVYRNAGSMSIIPDDSYSYSDLTAAADTIEEKGEKDIEQVKNCFENFLSWRFNEKFSDAFNCISKNCFEVGNTCVE